MTFLQTVASLWEVGVSVKCFLEGTMQGTGETTGDAPLVAAGAPDPPLVERSPRPAGRRPVWSLAAMLFKNIWVCT